MTVLKSTTLISSIQGMMKNSPGPFALCDVSRPNLKITALSYSVTIYTLILLSAADYDNDALTLIV